MAGVTVLQLKTIFLEKYDALLQNEKVLKKEYRNYINEIKTNALNHVATPIFESLLEGIKLYGIEGLPISAGDSGTTGGSNSGNSGNTGVDATGTKSELFLNDGAEISFKWNDLSLAPFYTRVNKFIITAVTTPITVKNNKTIICLNDLLINSGKWECEYEHNGIYLNGSAIIELISYNNVSKEMFVGDYPALIQNGQGVCKLTPYLAAINDRGEEDPVSEFLGTFTITNPA